MRDGATTPLEKGGDVSGFVEVVAVKAFEAADEATPPKASLLFVVTTYVTGTGPFSLDTT